MINQSIQEIINWPSTHPYTSGANTPLEIVASNIIQLIIAKGETEVILTNVLQLCISSELFHINQRQALNNRFQMVLFTINTRE